MELSVVETDRAPRANAPISQAIRLGDLLFVSGQLGRDPETRALGATIEEQTRQTMRNLGAILEAAGSSFDKVARTTVYLTDMADFAAMNEVYQTFFTRHLPARTTVEVKGLAKPEFRVEIDCIAAL